MATFPIPPTFASPVLINEETGEHQFNPIWMRWFLDAAQFFGSGATGEGLTVKQVNPQLVTPNIGTATGTSLTVTGRLVGGDINALVGATNALVDGAALGIATINNAPFGGNPSKWIPIVDNGVTRYIPAW